MAFNYTMMLTLGSLDNIAENAQFLNDGGYWLDRAIIVLYGEGFYGWSSYSVDYEGLRPVIKISKDQI